MTGRTQDSPADVDTLLRAALPDDLPPDVEARLEKQVEGFLLDRRRRADRSASTVVGRFLSASTWADAWSASRVLRVAASTALVVCGIALHAVGRPGVFAASMLRVNESVTLWENVRRTSAVRCTGVARDGLRSPAEVADRVYRDWVLVHSALVPTEVATVLTFESPRERARYELVVDSRSKLPRRIVKTWLPGATPPHDLATGYDATCTWEMSAPDPQMWPSGARRPPLESRGTSR